MNPIDQTCHFVLCRMYVYGSFALIGEQKQSEAAFLRIHSECAEHVYFALGTTFTLRVTSPYPKHSTPTSGPWTYLMKLISVSRSLSSDVRPSWRYQEEHCAALHQRNVWRWFTLVIKPQTWVTLDSVTAENGHYIIGVEWIRIVNAI